MNYDETFRMVLLAKKQGTRHSVRDQDEIGKFLSRPQFSQTHNLNGYQNGILSIPASSDPSKKKQKGRRKKWMRRI